MGKTYFASDFHLGIDGRLTSRERERQIIRWLNKIADDAEELFLVGDVFDYWFEYSKVVPKGYIRLLGKLAELKDNGLPIHYFTGNHDMWMFRYLEEELDVPIYREPILREFAGKKFLIGHGDGLGPGDYGYKFIKKVFANPASQWFFERLHPNTGIRLMNFFSGTSRHANPAETEFHGEEKERLVQFCNDYLDTQPIDFFIFGHRHLPIDFTLKNGKSRYINLGDWIRFNSYAVFDGEKLELKFFENDEGKVFGR
jgi:UDP-2,3-diacylglucosamine hydrolase